MLKSLVWSDKESDRSRDICTCHSVQKQSRIKLTMPLDCKVISYIFIHFNIQTSSIKSFCRLRLLKQYFQLFSIIILSFIEIFQSLLLQFVTCRNLLKWFAFFTLKGRIWINIMALTLSLIQHICSRLLWTYFVNKWKISIIEWIPYD